ncbi:CLUMA_CG019740, isoform A [Clunio marinus]|uniref:CLUMA_CG019740, isoform A n=1 Tax=Clunio marinus TaxID=568069 RepID=A0A1J1J593_9DIPT|nr:CLUMA_CG019740, isoform A [Clunio marinus]
MRDRTEENLQGFFDRYQQLAKEMEALENPPLQAMEDYLEKEKTIRLHITDQYLKAAKTRNITAELPRHELKA